MQGDDFLLKLMRARTEAIHETTTSKRHLINPQVPTHSYSLPLSIPGWVPSVLVRELFTEQSSGVGPLVCWPERNIVQVAHTKLVTYCCKLQPWPLQK